MAAAPPEDTIAAVATAAGRGGIGILRLSGPRAMAVGKALTGRTGFEPRHAHRAALRDAAGECIDDGLALSFPGPHSFTGDDVVELHCHGSPVVLDLLLEAACAHGARPAEPGEFSRRAFLNDKLDLAQAEAIADLIDSASAEAARNALRSLSGAFSDTSMRWSRRSPGSGSTSRQLSISPMRRTWTFSRRVTSRLASRRSASA